MDSVLESGKSELHPAGHRVVGISDGVHYPPDKDQHAGRAGSGLCADSEGEGRSEVEDHLQAYLAKRDDSGHHLRGTDDGLHFNRLSGCRKNFYHRRTGREVC